jgi:hypothetical protein
MTAAIIDSAPPANDSLTPRRNNGARCADCGRQSVASSVTCLNGKAIQKPRTRATSFPASLA